MYSNIKIQFIDSVISEGQAYGGVARAASELRRGYFLEGHTFSEVSVEDLGDIVNRDLYFNQNMIYQDFYEKLIQKVDADSIQLIVGGDHSQSIATIPALLHARPNTGVIWIDAHGDMNTPMTSPTGNLHGMPLAVLLGLVEDGDLSFVNFAKNVLKPSQLVMIGVRDLDAGEIEHIEHLGIKVFKQSEVEKKGVQYVVEQALDHLKQYENIHVSFDIDAIDPEYAPTTGVPVENGLNINQVSIMTELLALSNKVKSLEIVEVNPDLAIDPADWLMVVQIIKMIIGQTLRSNKNYSYVVEKPSLSFNWVV